MDKWLPFSHTHTLKYDKMSLHEASRRIQMLWGLCRSDWHWNLNPLTAIFHTVFYIAWSQIQKYVIVSSTRIWLILVLGKWRILILIADALVEIRCSIECKTGWCFPCLNLLVFILNNEAHYFKCSYPNECCLWQNFLTHQWLLEEGRKGRGRMISKSAAKCCA